MLCVVRHWLRLCVCVCAAAAESQQIVQKKTFTKWINSRLSADSGRPSITDLFDDLRDGTHLLLLLETLAGITLVSIGSSLFPSVLWRCWLGDRKSIRPVKTGCWFVGADDLTGDLHDLQLRLSPTTSITLSFNKIQNGDILIPANSGSLGKMAFKTERERERERERAVSTQLSSISFLCTMSLWHSADCWVSVVQCSLSEDWR